MSYDPLELLFCLFLFPPYTAHIVKLDGWGKKALSTFVPVRGMPNSRSKDKHLCGLHQLKKDHHEIKSGIDYAKIYWFLSISGNKKGHLEVI